MHPRAVAEGAALGVFEPRPGLVPGAPPPGQELPPRARARAGMGAGMGAGMDMGAGMGARPAAVLAVFSAKLLQASFWFLRSAEARRPGD